MFTEEYKEQSVKWLGLIIYFNVTTFKDESVRLMFV